MADLNNITQFSGITITSDQVKGTNNPNATFAVANITTEQRDSLENVTPYVVNEKTVKVKPGTRIYNITTKTEQVFLEGEWRDAITGQVDAGKTITFAGRGGSVTLNTDIHASVQIQETGKAGKTIIQSPQLNNNITYIFPNALPVANQILQATNVSDGVVTLGWVNK